KAAGQAQRPRVSARPPNRLDDFAHDLERSTGTLVSISKRLLAFEPQPALPKHVCRGALAFPKVQPPFLDGFVAASGGGAYDRDSSAKGDNSMVARGDAGAPAQVRALECPFLSPWRERMVGAGGGSASHSSRSPSRGPSNHSARATA